jgi:hypothetical protein
MRTHEYAVIHTVFVVGQTNSPYYSNRALSYQPGWLAPALPFLIVVSIFIAVSVRNFTVEILPFLTDKTAVHSL